MNRFFTLLLAASCLTAVGQVPDYVPTEGLVAWLPMNGDFDGWSSQNVSWDVVGTSSGTDRFGLPNAAISFNGSSDWASSSQSLIPTEGDFTISIWLLGHDNGLHAEGIAQGGSNINSTYIGHTPEGNIRVGGGGNWAWDNLEVYPFDVWTHFLVTKTASISTLYLNGEVYSTSTAYTNPVNSGSTYLGKQQNPSYTEYWDGLIDDVGVWQRALNPDEIAALHNWSPTQGCLDESACNFDEDAVINDNSCDLFSCRCLDGTIWSEELGGCIVDESACGWQPDGNGDNLIGVNDLLDLLGVYGDTDYDQDGIWDSADDCVGEYDECGVCNGSGPSIPIIESIEILYDSVYAEPIDEWLVFEVGADTTFSYTCFEWQCGDPLEYQGYDYETVQIGEQCWFAENLRSENYTNGDTIPAGLTVEWSSITSGATAVYVDTTSHLDSYGRLYNWYAVNDSRSLCPSGWSVPTDEEWIIMEMALGMDEIAANGLGFRGTDQGTQMKASPSDSPSWNGSNSSRFSGAPGGWRSSTDGAFGYIGARGHWWSSSPEGDLAWNRFLDSEFARVAREYSDRNAGFSVRCIKDAE